MLAEDFLGGFCICVVDNPLTGYLFLLEVAKLPTPRAPLFVGEVAAAVALLVVLLSLGCFGRTNAFVCFSRYRSLHSAEINGKSRLRLFSRSVRMSSIPSSFLSTFSSVQLADLPDLLVVAMVAIVPDEEAATEEAGGSG